MKVAGRAAPIIQPRSSIPHASRLARCGMLLTAALLLGACGGASGDRESVASSASGQASAPTELAEALPAGAPAARPSGKVIVLGLDAATWRVMDPLLAAGKLPNIAALLARGCRAPLRTLYPTISPLVWTSIATGVPAELHGRDFTITRIPGTYRFSQDTGALLTYPALWHVADHYGLSSVTINWYSADSPWEPRRSRVLADRIGDDRAEPLRFPSFELPGLAFAAPEDGQLFSELGLSPDPLLLGALRPWLRRELNVLRWRLGEDRYFHEAALRLFFREGEPQPDLAMILLRNLDGAQHKFWEFMDAANFAQTDPRERQAFGRLIEGWYVFYDRLVGEYVERAEPGTTFILLSDHGMEPIVDQEGRTRPEDERARRNMSRYRPASMEGLLEAMGLLAREPGDPGDLRRAIDWPRTRVFPNRDKALTWEVGLFVNLRGREPQGAVEPKDYANFLAETASRLRGIRTAGAGQQAGKLLFLEVEVRPHDRSAEILARVNPGLDLDAELEVEGRRLPLSRLLEPYDLSAAHHFAPDGILLIAGPDVRPGSRLEAATIYDVAPTVCMLLGLPLAGDFAGRPLAELFRHEPSVAAQTPRVTSFREVVPGFAPAGRTESAADGGLEILDPEAAERLRSLGYIQ